LDWLVPDTPLSNILPPMPATEAGKFENNSLYLEQKTRWLIAHYSNQYMQTFESTGNPQNRPYHERLRDYIKRCFQGYYGEQNPDKFNFATTIAAGATTTSPLIAGQDIRPLANHMIGNIIKTIQPMGRQISAIGLSREIYDRKTQYWTMLRNKNELGDDKLAQLESLGVTIKAPNAAHDQITSEDELQDAMENFKDDYEQAAINIDKSIYFTDDLHNKLIEGLSQQIIGGLTKIRVKAENGTVTNKIIPAWNALHDHNATDIYGTDAKVGGGVFWYSADQIIAMHPDMDDNSKQWLQTITTDAAAFYREWINESGVPSGSTWVTKDGLISYAEVLWIEARDSRYQLKENVYGDQFYQKINDEGDYPQGSDASNSTGKVLYLKGAKIPGIGIFDVYRTILVANCKLLAAGYDDYAVRPANNMAMPRLPIISLCHGERFGFFKSIVGSLLIMQGEVDYVSKRVRDSMARDKGMVHVFDGSQLTASMKRFLEDIEAMGIFITNRESGEAVESDPNNKRPLVEKVDMTLDQNIQWYLKIKERLVAEMQYYVSIPNVALGQQTSTIGKGVQENTVAYATQGQLSIYESCNEFIKKLLQFNFDLAKLVYTDTENDKIERVLPISQSQVALLKLTKDFRGQDIGIYLMPNDTIDADGIAMLKSFIQAIAQNIQVLTQWGLMPDNVLGLMRIQTFDEGIRYLEIARKKNMKVLAAQQQQQAQTDQNMNAQQLQAQEFYKAAFQLLKEDNANYRAELLALQKHLAELMQTIQTKEPPQSPLLTQFANGGGQQQQAMPQGGQQGMGQDSQPIQQQGGQQAA
jgi:hypothetical protein